MSIQTNIYEQAIKPHLSQISTTGLNLRSQQLHFHLKNSSLHQVLQYHKNMLVLLLRRVIFTKISVWIGREYSFTRRISRYTTFSNFEIQTISDHPTAPRINFQTFDTFCRLSLNYLQFWILQFEYLSVFKRQSMWILLFDMCCNVDWRVIELFFRQTT